MKHYLESADERLGDDEVQKLGKKNVNEYPFNALFRVVRTVRSLC